MYIETLIGGALLAVLILAARRGWLKIDGMQPNAPVFSSRPEAFFLAFVIPCSAMLVAIVVVTDPSTALASGTEVLIVGLTMVARRRFLGRSTAKND